MGDIKVSKRMYPLIAIICLFQGITFPFRWGVWRTKANRHQRKRPAVFGLG